MEKPDGVTISSRKLNSILCAPGLRALSQVWLPQARRNVREDERRLRQEEPNQQLLGKAGQEWQEE
jgi:hypothetical protein